ncbi:TPA: GntP family permease [Escherichia coli]
MSPLMLVLNLVISVGILLFLIIKIKINPAIALIIASIYMGVSCNLGLVQTATTISTGFGNMMAGIGLPIGFGIILGEYLSICGGAHSIAHRMVAIFPGKLAVYALMLTAFVLCIPVFFDVVVVILLPIAIALSKQINRPFPVMMSAIMIGAGASFTFVPPTPAPLAAATIMNFDLGVMIFVGIAISLVIMPISMTVLSKVLSIPSYWKTETDEKADFNPSIEEQNFDKLPPAVLAMIPILLPVFCILLGTSAKAMYGDANVPAFIAFLGDKVVALLLGTLVAYFIAAKYVMKNTLEGATDAALKNAGIVLMITGAGGSFAAIIKDTNIGNALIEGMGASGLSVIPMMLMAYGIAMIMRLAQGSGAVAGMTAMGIMAGVAASCNAHPVYIAFACLTGGMSFPHVNDSGFWIVSNLGGLTVSGTFKSYTVINFLNSLIGLSVAMVAAVLFPMV